MAWWVNQSDPLDNVPDSYYQALQAFPPEVQFMVLHSRELERTDPKAARKLLFDNPQVVIARKQAALALLGRR